MLLLRGAIEVVTPPATSLPLAGEAMNKIERHPKTDILIDGDKIVDIGKNLESDGADIIDVSGKVIMPGFVDPHTHPVFYNKRDSEYAMRLSGSSYEEIANNGGGIISSVNGKNILNPNPSKINAIANSIIVSTKNDIPSPIDIENTAIINVRLVCLANFPATASVRIREIPNTKKRISTSTIVIALSFRNAG